MFKSESFIHGDFAYPCVFFHRFRGSPLHTFRDLKINEAITFGFLSSSQGASHKGAFFLLPIVTDVAA
jgi:hypothetical protein